MKELTDRKNQASLKYTIQSDGAKVARFHLFDWLVLAVLIVLEGLLQPIHPFNRFVSKNMMDDLKYPLKPNTVPMWAVPLYALLLPMIVFTVYYFRRRNVYDLHNAILGLLYSVAISAFITDTMKKAVGRPRPDFFWRCFPDAIEEYDGVGNAICHGVNSVIREGHQSFPSGHSSRLGFLSLYLCGKMRVFDRNGHIAKLVVVVLPLIAATLVATSRVDDYRHHWQDVVAGGFLGIVAAFLCYHQFFPLPNEPNGWEPYACVAGMKDQVYINGEGQAHVEDKMNDSIWNVHSYRS